MRAMPGPRRTRTLQWLALAGLTVLAAGCGFQPRGTATSLTALPAPVQISGIAQHSDLYRELALQLRRSGAEPVTAGGATVLRVTNNSRQARVLSVDSRDRVVEQELEEVLSVAMHIPARDEPAIEFTERVLRIQFVPKENPLGGEREAEYLRSEMRRDLVRRVVQRLATWANAHPTR